MRTDVLQLTDIINTKVIGMSSLIDRWLPHDNTIKNTLLQDIQFITNQISVFNNKTQKPTSPTTINHKKCRNGSSCWYFQQGRCWFNHDTQNTNCNTTANYQTSRVTQTNSNSNTQLQSTITQHFQRTKKTKKTRKPKQTKTPRAEQRPNGINIQPKNPKKKRRRRKKNLKKKQNIDEILQEFSYNSDSNTSYNPSPSPSSSTSPKADESIVNSPVGIMPVIFDTVDQVNAVISEKQLWEKIDCFADIQTKVDALNAISKICSVASSNKWTYKETLKQIDCTLLNLI